MPDAVPVAREDPKTSATFSGQEQTVNGQSASGRNRTVLVEVREIASPRSAEAVAHAMLLLVGASLDDKLLQQADREMLRRLVSARLVEKPLPIPETPEDVVPEALEAEAGVPIASRQRGGIPTLVWFLLVSICVVIPIALLLLRFLHWGTSRRTRHSWIPFVDQARDSRTIAETCKLPNLVGMEKEPEAELEPGAEPESEPGSEPGSESGVHGASSSSADWVRRGSAKTSEAAASAGLKSSGRALPTSHSAAVRHCPIDALKVANAASCEEGHMVSIVPEFDEFFGRLCLRTDSRGVIDDEFMTIESGLFTDQTWAMSQKSHAHCLAQASSPFTARQSLIDHGFECQSVSSSGAGDSQASMVQQAGIFRSPSILEVERQLPFVRSFLSPSFIALRRQLHVLGSPACLPPVPPAPPPAAWAESCEASELNTTVHILMDGDTSDGAPPECMSRPFALCKRRPHRPLCVERESAARVVPAPDLQVWEGVSFTWLAD